MALFCVFGMISFLYGLVPSGMRSINDPVVGDLNGQQVTHSQLAVMRNEWQTLKDLHYVDPNKPDTYDSFLNRVMDGPANIITQNPDTFFLLVQEAHQRGMTVSDDEVESLLTNNVANAPPEGTDARDLVAQSVRDCLLVVDLLNSNLELVKTNAPVRELWKARDAQALALNLVNFSADHYLPKVGTPTEEDIKNQYDTYSDRIALEQNYGEADDPLGFGYKYTNRVKVQFIGLKADDVYAAAKASQSQQDWYVAAYGEFKANRDQYDQEPVAGPATKPSRLGPAVPAAPAARRVDDLDADFALHVPQVLEHLYQQSADALRLKLLHQISDALDEGYSAWHDAQVAGTATQSSGGVQYTDMGYIENLARTIEQQTGVLPVIGYSDQLKDAKGLLQTEGIGQSVANTITGEQVPFAEYALMDTGHGGLAVWQPSDVFHDEASNVFIFRISELDAAHTPPLSEVRDKVISDWKLATAYKMALDAAKNMLADAQKRGFAAAAASAGDEGSSVITTDLFRPSAIVAHPQDNTGIPPLRLSPVSIYLLAVDSQKLVSAPPGADGRPIDVAELWPDGIVSVMELQEATPLWDVTNGAAADYEADRAALHDQRTKMINDLCTYASAAERLNYKPIEVAKLPATP